MKISTDRGGFTLLELLVVISIIGVLASVILGSLNIARDRARRTAAEAGLMEIYKAIESARIQVGGVLELVTDSYYSSGAACRDAPDLRNISTDHQCYINMYNSFVEVNNASGDMLEGFIGSNRANSNLRDPWGSPYLWDENELEGGNCGKDNMRSVGPDGDYNTTDDIIFYLPLVSRQCM